MPDVHDMAHPALLAEVTHAPGSVGRPTTPENEAGLAVPERLQQLLVVIDVVFEVRILDENKSPVAAWQTAADGVSFALV